MSNLAIESISLLMGVISKDLLIYCFPSLSNAIFKLLLLEFKCSSKAIETSVLCLSIAYRRIFQVQDNYALKEFVEQHSRKQMKGMLNKDTGVVDLLKLKNHSANAKGSSNSEGVFKKENIEVIIK